MAHPPQTLPAVPTFSAFGDTAHSWESVATFFDEFAAEHVGFAPVATFVRSIVASGYPAAGLSIVQSMHDIILGPSTRVLDNPHLVVSYNLLVETFTFEYRDGSRVPWTRTVAPVDAMDSLERFLLRRMRWFQVAPSTSGLTRR